MTLRKHFLPAGLGLLFLVAPALAQTPAQRIILEQSSGLSRQEGPVRVQSAVSFYVAGPTGEGEEAQKLRDRARRAVYEMAAHECRLLQEVLAKDCRLVSVNSNINRQFGHLQQEGFTVSGSMSMQITLK